MPMEKQQAAVSNVARSQSTRDLERPSSAHKVSYWRTNPETEQLEEILSLSSTPDSERLEWIRFSNAIHGATYIRVHPWMKSAAKRPITPRPNNAAVDNGADPERQKWVTDPEKQKWLKMDNKIHGATYIRVHPWMKSAAKRPLTPRPTDTAVDNAAGSEKKEEC